MRLREPMEPTRTTEEIARQRDRPRGAQRSTASDEVTVPLDRLRGSRQDAIATRITSMFANRRGGGWFKRPLPRWAWPIIAVAAGLLVLLLPLLFYQRPGFTVVVRGVPFGSQLFVDDVRRGIPGIETAGDQTTGLVRAHGLKPGVSHLVRLSCGGRDSTLYLDNGSSINDLSAEDGEVVNLRAKCEGIAEEVEETGKMRLVVAGPFWMGDNNGEENERPAHLVTTLNYDYYIDKFEVTNRQYQEFCQTAGIKPPSEPYWDGSYSINQPDSPVVGVSWNDAKSYCEKVGKRLPTEAEWEKAASWDPRATDDSMRWKRSWPWGNSFDPALVNFASPRPTAASQFPAGISAYGVYQMAGNAGEWVEDVYQPYPGSQARAQEFDGLKRVVRGGTFKSESGQYLRTTMRFGQQPILSQQQLVKKSWLIGFRCAVRVDEPARQKRLKESNR